VAARLLQVVVFPYRGCSFHGGNTDEKDPSRISTLSAKKRCVSCVPDLQIHVACERAVAEGVLADVLSPIERRRGMLLPNTI
jgi:hypothetical protein